MDIDIDELTRLINQVRYWNKIEAAALEARHNADLELNDAELHRAQAQGKLRQWIDAQTHSEDVHLPL